MDLRLAPLFKSEAWSLAWGPEVRKREESVADVNARLACERGDAMRTREFKGGRTVYHRLIVAEVLHKLPKHFHFRQGPAFMIQLLKRRSPLLLTLMPPLPALTTAAVTRGATADEAGWPPLQKPC